MIPVLDKGYARLEAVHGDDLLVVNAARVSFDKRSHWETWHAGPIQLANKDQKLLNYLARMGHWSPFSHPQMTFEVKAPLFVARQWYKHRVGHTYTDDEDREMWEECLSEEPDDEGWNEKSFRYVEPDDFYVPADDQWRTAPENKKQGSGPTTNHIRGAVRNMRLREVFDHAFREYKTAIDQDFAPEQVRLFLPANAQYTSFYWTTSLKGVLRFLKLRLPSDSQFEIRQYASVVFDLVQPLFPYSFAAYKMEELRV